MQKWTELLSAWKSRTPLRSLYSDVTSRTFPSSGNMQPSTFTDFPGYGTTTEDQILPQFTTDSVLSHFLTTTSAFLLIVITIFGLGNWILVLLFVKDKESRTTINSIVCALAVADGILANIKCPLELFRTLNEPTAPTSKIYNTLNKFIGM